MGYTQLLKQSWTDCTKNLIVIVPLLLQMIAAIVGMIVSFVAAAAIFRVASGFSFSLETFDPTMLSPTLIPLGIILLLIFLLIMTVIGAYFQSGYFAMIVEAIRKGKTTMATFVEGGKRYFTTYFGYSIVVGILWLILMAPLVAGAALLFMKQNTGIPLLLVGLFLLLVIGIIIAFILFFSKPLLFFNNIGIVEIFRQSWAYVQQEFVHILIVFAITIGISIGVGVVLRIVILPFSILADQTQVFETVVGVLNILRSIVQALAGIWLTFFLFRAYAEKPIAKPKGR